MTLITHFFIVSVLDVWNMMMINRTLFIKMYTIRIIRLYRKQELCTGPSRRTHSFKIQYWKDSDGKEMTCYLFVKCFQDGNVLRSPQPPPCKQSLLELTSLLVFNRATGKLKRGKKRLRKVFVFYCFVHLVN